MSAINLILNEKLEIMTDLTGNVLIMQLGAPTVVMNACLSALVTEVLNFDCVEEVYGSKDGIDGLIEGKLIDLASTPQKTIKNLHHTPGAALGSIVRDISKEGLNLAFNTIKEKGIKFLFVIGDETAVGCFQKIDEFASDNNVEIKTIFIPFSANNLLPLTDHCLGYPSMVKQLACTVKSIIAENRLNVRTGSVSIIELRDCNNNWLLAGATLCRARFDSSLPPHITLLSDEPCDEKFLLQTVRETMVSEGNCVILSGGNVVLGSESNGNSLADVILNNFDVCVNVYKISDWKNSSMRIISGVDASEAAECAKRAASMLMSFGVTGKMLTLLRSEGIKYSAEITCVDIANVAGKIKTFTNNLYDSEALRIDSPFFKYCLPLIEGEVVTTYEAGLPTFASF